MPPWRPSASAFRRRLVGLYALTLMEREGPVHGYGISERIAERTEGVWRPGPGAVYPSLQKLVLGGLARPRTEGRRRVYTITRKGRALLASIRTRSDWNKQSRPDLGSLWAEVMGAEGVGGLLLLRLRRTLDSMESYLLRHPDDAEALRESAVAELSRSLKRVRATDRSSHRIEVADAR